MLEDPCPLARTRPATSLMLLAGAELRNGWRKVVHRPQSSWSGAGQEKRPQCRWLRRMLDSPRQVKMTIEFVKGKVRPAACCFSGEATCLLPAACCFYRVADCYLLVWGGHFCGRSMSAFTEIHPFLWLHGFLRTHWCREVPKPSMPTVAAS